MRIFISACLNKATDDEGKRKEAQRNEAMMDALFNDLTALGVRKIEKVIGKYQGQLENSFSVLLGKVNALKLVELAAKYNQESILLVTMNDNAFLKFIDGDGSGEVKEIGAVFYSDSEPKNMDYSYFPATNKYMFIVE
jgi:hypothetical protein